MYHPRVSPPPYVLRAILQGDKLTLSHFGKKGVEKRNQGILVRQMNKELMLDGTQEMATQANEHICPVD